MSSKNFKDYLVGVVNDCFDAVQESKIGPLICYDKAHLIGHEHEPRCASAAVTHNLAFQTFLTLVQSVAPKYLYNEITHIEPREPWQEPGGEMPNPGDENDGSNPAD